MEDMDMFASPATEAAPYEPPPPPSMAAPMKDAPVKAKKSGVLSKVADALSSVFGGEPEPEAAEEEKAPSRERARAISAPRARMVPVSPPASLVAPVVVASEIAVSKEESNRSQARDKGGVGFDEGALARMQGADGSFGGDIGRTAAALLALLLRGHTRRMGLRSRTVIKAAAWLEQHRSDARANLALSALEAAERGESLVPDAAWRALVGLGAEGQALAAAM